LEEVVGEIRGENEAVEEPLRYLGPGRWRVSGQYRLEEFRRAYPALREVPEVATLGGLMLVQLEIVPKAGQSIVCQGLRLTAEEVDERRVRKILVEVLKKK
jgi:CBS domain containing-hemolysin-like protein